MANCSITAAFKPTQKGNRTGTLSITDNAPNSPQTVALSGTGTVVKLNPSSLSFNCSHRKHNCPPPPQSTVLTNVGSAPLAVNSIKITGQYFSGTNNCPMSLGPHQSCTITVDFNPKNLGTYNGAVSVSDDGGGSPQQVALSAKEGLSQAALSTLSMTETTAVPNPTGPKNVGTRIMQMVDPLRHDPFLGNGFKRELMVRF